MEAINLEGYVCSRKTWCMELSARITEKSLYSAIQKVLAEFGAKVVVEPRKITEPDFVIDWLGERWLMSVKIGDIGRLKFIKDAFIQLFNELRDFSDVLRGSNRAILLIYPENIKEIKLEHVEIERAVRERAVYAIVLQPQMELRAPLPIVLKNVEETLRRRIPITLSLKTVTSLLKAQIEEIMSEVKFDEGLMNVIKNPELFFGINPVEKDPARRCEVLRNVLSFLGAYIFLSQALFLRLYYEKAPTILENIDPRDISKDTARKLFDKLKRINYKPIFEVDVLDYVYEKLISNTFKLLFALQIDNIRHELPGRLFHELMPDNVRKLLAAFYTRPIAAYLLAQLTIDDPNVTVFDPACGSGTILAMAYRRKLELWKELGNPHRKFCEEHIFGCDIMPFAVHLTNANLIAMDPLTTVNYTQIIQKDSLQLVPFVKVVPGLKTMTEYTAGGREINVKVNVYSRTGELVEIFLRPVDVVLMNPPFTKVERGIKKYINTEKFEDIVGGEVGLWGCFVALADMFLKEEGVFGAVLPINVLRGRESRNVREIIFKQWLPLYVIKPSRNYGFSEYAEYRDILMIAKKTHRRPENHKVKFCIIKKDLNELTDEEAKRIAELIKSSDKLRSNLLDVESHPLQDVYRRFENMMYFIAGPSLSGSEVLRCIIEEAEKLFKPFPPNYFREGYGPRPKNSSKFMFITRPGEGRLDEAFLALENETNETLTATTPAGVQKFTFSKKHFLPALRTPVGLKKMNVTKLHDYVAKEPYENIDKVMNLSNFKEVEKINKNYWEKYVKGEFERSSTHVTVVRRVNPYSPAQSLIAFNSQCPLIVSDLFHAINEANEEVRKAITVLLNSIFSLAYIFSGKEETTGRYIDIRQYDLYGMRLFPNKDQVRELAKVYEKYREEEFPSLRKQLDIYYDTRYESFWVRERRGQAILMPPPPVEPHPLRLRFDLDVVKSLGSNLTKDDILKAYEAIVWDMIITRGLRKD
jgi:type I restriction-modification system DNA methylase subunit